MIMKDGIQILPQNQVCVREKEFLNQLLTESIPPCSLSESTPRQTNCSRKQTLSIRKKTCKLLETFGWVLCFCACVIELLVHVVLQVKLYTRSIKGSGCFLLMRLCVDLKDRNRATMGARGKGV